MNTDNFIWTDKLVKEFIEWDKTRIHTSVDSIYLFKASKQQPVRDEKCLFNEEKINTRLHELSLMEEGFNIAREVHSNNPTGITEFFDGGKADYYPVKYKTFFDYCKQKQNL